MEYKNYSFELKNNFERIKSVESVLVKGDLSQPNPKLSILVPTFRRADLLKRALDSALNQTIKENYEIVICDNDDNFSCVSETQALVEAYADGRIFYYKNKKNLGAENNFNRLLELAHGEYVAYLHDDDFFEPNFVKEALKRARDDTAVFFVYNTVNEMSQQKNRGSLLRCVLKKTLRAATLPLYFFNPKKNNIDLWDMFLMQPEIGFISHVYKKSCLINIGGFDVEHYPATDYELNIKYIMHYGARYVKKTVGNYWIGANDSMKSCVLFPQSNYDMRLSLIPFLKEKKEQTLKKLAEIYVATDFAGIKDLFGVEDLSFDNEILEIARNITLKEKKYAFRKRRVNNLLKLRI